jgi:hypothetical protein
MKPFDENYEADECDACFSGHEQAAQGIPV